MHAQGDPIEFEFSSADASGGGTARLVLRKAGGRDSVTLGANDRVILLTLAGNVTTTTAKVLADTDGDLDADAGDLMAQLSTGRNFVTFGPNGMSGALARIPSVLAAAGGQIDISGTGVIIRG